MYLWFIFNEEYQTMTNDKIIQRLERGSSQVQRTCSKFNKLFFYERGVPDVDLVLPLVELAAEEGIQVAESDEWPKCTRGGNTEGDLVGTLMTDAKNELIAEHGTAAVFHTQKEMREARNILFISSAYTAYYQRIIRRKLGLDDAAPTLAAPSPTLVNTPSSSESRGTKVRVNQIFEGAVKAWKPKNNDLKPGYIKVITHILQLIEADPEVKAGEKRALFGIMERSLWYPEHDVSPAKYAVRIRSLEAEKAEKKGDVVFEHVYPKLWVRNEVLLKIKNPTFEKVQEALDKYLIVALITKSEDEELNKPKYKHLIGFDRYKAAGISLASVLRPGERLT